MKAIARSGRSLTMAITAAGLALLASCAAPPPPAPIRAPAPVPAPPPPAPPLLPAKTDWRDLMPSSGTWQWSMVAGRSTAQYVASGGPPLASLSCDRTTGQVLLARSGSAAEAVAMGISTTSTGNRPVLSNPQLGGNGWIVTALPARDPLLDAMAFSRGRFLFEVAGLTPLVLPSWPEVSRVIEDCRQG